MGLAASQARLLLLTARKSDLEFRAQQITNSEMILAMQTEQIAREYSIKISNQALFYTDGSDATSAMYALTATDIADLTGGAYSIQERGVGDDDDTWHTWVPGQATSTEVLWTDGKGNTITQSDYDALPQSEKDKCTKQTTTNDAGETVDVTATYTQRYTDSDIAPLALLEGLKRGTLRIVDANGQVIDLNGNNGFTQSYYTDDDREAEAKYEQQTSSIQVKEKRLQNDLNQIETQQKACDTEIDSVKKVMEKNIERTFKVFS